jgi:hypothetical protein
MLEGLRDGGGSMAIRIGLDHGHQLDASPYCSLDHAEVEGNAIE